MEKLVNRVVDHIINNCAGVSSDNRVIIIYDDTTEEVVQYFSVQLQNKCKLCVIFKIEVANRHGEEPSLELRKELLNSDIAFCITKYSLAHTTARKLANEAGIKFLSMPEYNMDMLLMNALMVDYKSCLGKVEELSEKLSNAKRLEVTSESGTELFLDVGGREGNCCPGFVSDKYLLGSPPDIEVNIAPVEDKTYGKIVIDGSVTHEKLGLTDENIVIEVQEGKIVSIQSSNKKQEKILIEILKHAGSKKAKILGELGIGLNPNATLCGNMLVDEGTYGCIHFGFGSNWTIGGMNKVDFHLDFVIKEPTLIIDECIVIKKGELL